MSSTDMLDAHSEQANQTYKLRFADHVRQTTFWDAEAKFGRDQDHLVSQALQAVHVRCADGCSNHFGGESAAYHR